MSCCDVTPQASRTGYPSYVFPTGDTQPGRWVTPSTWQALAKGAACHLAGVWGQPRKGLDGAQFLSNPLSPPTRRSLERGLAWTHCVEDPAFRPAFPAAPHSCAGPREAPGPGLQGSPGPDCRRTCPKPSPWLILEHLWQGWCWRPRGQSCKKGGGVLILFFCFKQDFIF